jgi:hypothetical protein
LIWATARLARTAKIAEPDQSDLASPARFPNIFRFSFHPNHIHILGRPVPKEGRFAIVTDVRRDAVDAGGALTNVPGLRTAKSCGSDAPMLASSWRKQFRSTTVANKPVAGKSTKEPVKTIA